MSELFGLKAPQGAWHRLGFRPARCPALAASWLRIRAMPYVMLAPDDTRLRRATLINWPTSDRHLQRSLSSHLVELRGVESVFVHYDVSHSGRTSGR
eukprot:16415924-Heterocapsa_arctica.AAC.1